MVGVAQKQPDLEQVDLYDKMPNIKSCFGYSSSGFYVNKSHQSKSDYKHPEAGHITACTIDFDACRLTWKNETTG